MLNTIFITAAILLCFCIVRQLIVLATTIQYLSKDKVLLQQKAAEEDAYLFVKGLY
ncbi:hypothetical protein ECE50_012260 [Chitinophaga sp. Mgbs1]|uniref:Uncharacterized protein n=1 Tax=Chitinophaga solisilvae TaxID=1233460 RepID=A0A9Q5D9B0_9BACT|nr:hypothetical protein [Chitinophaga solisilvae]